jgi:hypothetical protein
MVYGILRQVSCLITVSLRWSFKDTCTFKPKCDTQYPCSFNPASAGSPKPRHIMTKGLLELTDRKHHKGTAEEITGLDEGAYCLHLALPCPPQIR